MDSSREALRFASEAKDVVMHPRLNEVADDKAVIRRMRAEIDALRRQLVRVMMIYNKEVSDGILGASAEMNNL